MVERAKASHPGDGSGRRSYEEKMILGFVTKKHLKKVTEDYERKLGKVFTACETKIQGLKEKCLGSDKMYARSNEIKFKAIDQRIMQLEQILAEQLSQFKDKNKDQADEAHAKMNKQSEQ